MVAKHFEAEIAEMHIIQGLHKKITLKRPYQLLSYTVNNTCHIFMIGVVYFYCIFMP